MSNPETEFNAALSKYHAGNDLISVEEDFNKIVSNMPNNFAAWTCLSWLQLLLKKNEDALNSAKLAVKLNPQDPQARMNLCLGLLATKTKGVRDHVETIKRMLVLAPDLEEELKSSIADGFAKYPEWPELKKIQNWIEIEIV